MKRPASRNRLPAAAICAALAGGFCLAAQHAPAPGAPPPAPSQPAQPAAPGAAPAPTPAPVPPAPRAAPPQPPAVDPASQVPSSPGSSAPRSRRQRLDPPRYPPTRFEAKSKDLNDYYDEPAKDAATVEAGLTPEADAPADTTAAAQGAPPPPLPAVRTVPSAGPASAATPVPAAPSPAPAPSSPGPPWIASIAAAAMLLGPAIALLWLGNRPGPGAAN